MRETQSVHRARERAYVMSGRGGLPCRLEPDTLARADDQYLQCVHLEVGQNAGTIPSRCGSRIIHASPNAIAAHPVRR